MFELENLAGECSFCYRRVEEGWMRICSCETEMCPEHAGRHTNPEHLQIEVEVSGKMPALQVVVNDGGIGVDAEKIENTVRDMVLFPNMVGKKKKLKECPHIEKSKVVVGGSGCCTCEISNNTWICAACGTCLCGRKQFGIEGNGHAQEHYEKDPSHCVFVKRQSINKKRKECEVYCYKCDEIVKSAGVFELLDIREEIGTPLTTEQIEKGLNQSVQASAQNKGADYPESSGKEIMYEVVRQKGGIVNMGNTCYMSCILQVLGHMVRNEMHRTEFFGGAEGCEGCPLRCFACQLKKVLERVAKEQEDLKCEEVPANKRRKSANTEDAAQNNAQEGLSSFGIDAFWNTIDAIYPKYVLGTQQDTSEFYEDLMNTIRTYDEIGHFSMLSEPFRTELVSRTECARCKEAAVHNERSSVLYLGTEQTVEQFFKKEEISAECGCGSDKKIRTMALLSPPEVLVVGVKREAEKTSRQEKEIPLAVEIPVLETEKNRQKQEWYDLEAATVHEGTLNAGHYMAIVKKPEGDDEWALYDDEKIGNAPFMASNAVLLFYKHRR